MTAVPKKQFYSEAEYLELERAAEFRSEYYDGEIFAMAGAKFAHNRVKENLAGELFRRPKGGRCQTLSSDMRVNIPRAKAFTYPDILIVCGEPVFLDDKHDTLLNPVVIIEVLSPSTENFNRRGKFRRYQKIATLQEYILVAQDEPLCERFVRGEDDSWILTTFDDPAGQFALATISARIPMADIYRGVEFPPDPPSSRPPGRRDIPR